MRGGPGSNNRGVDKVQSLRRRMMIMDLLTLLKKKYKYSELSDITGLPPSVLSRYARGRMLPSDERTDEILRSLMKSAGLEDLARERIRTNKGGYYDVTELVWDVPLLRLIAIRVSESLSRYGVSKILTAAADGVPLASLIGEELGATLVVAKERREVGPEEFLEDSYSPADVAIVRTLYVPRGAMRRNDRVLVVDDVVRTGATVASLIRLTEAARAKAVGIFTIVSVGDKWRDVVDRYAIPHFSLLRLPQLASR